MQKTEWKGAACYDKTDYEWHFEGRNSRGVHCLEISGRSFFDEQRCLFVWKGFLWTMSIDNQIMNPEFFARLAFLFRCVG